jgi:hypothetical protein
LLIADVPTPNWNPDYQGAGILPGSGPVTINNAQRAAQLNQLNAAIVAKHPQSRVLPYAEGLEAPDGSVDPRLRPDGLHLLPVTAEEVMNAWLAQLIVSAYQSVTAELPTTLTRVTSWAP